MRDGPESPWGLEGFSLARDESSAAKTPVNGGAVHYQAPEVSTPQRKRGVFAKKETCIVVGC